MTKHKQARRPQGTARCVVPRDQWTTIGLQLLDDDGFNEHARSPVARAELPGTVASTAQRSSQGAQPATQQACSHAPPLTARTP
ncbi:hypothetical protein [Bordetella hinzii]|uniref:hypothetical protein n=1 Tax=Bordetella hinzii TaxID=103855 RepID=UPI003F5213BA